MTSSFALYRKAMEAEWKGRWLTWPLSGKVQVGDVLRVTENSTRPAGTLADKGIDYRTSAGAPPSFFKYDSNSAAAVRFKAAGTSAQGFSALAVADAGALVEFHQDGALLVVYRDLTTTGISDTAELAAHLVERYWDGAWQEDWHVVTDVVSVSRGTVLAAAAKGGSVELRANASVGGAIVTIADLAADVSVVRSHSLGLEWIGAGLTPFFHVARLRRSWLGSIRTDYGPRQREPRALPQPSVPRTVLREAREAPETVLESLSGTSQPQPVDDTGSE